MTKETPTPPSYHEKTVRSIMVHCEAHGIKDTDAVMAALTKHHGGRGLEEMSDAELRRVNSNIPHFLLDYEAVDAG